MKVENGELKEVSRWDLRLLKRKPEKFWKGITKIGSCAFNYCLRNLKSIVIPEGVTEIDERGFAKCFNLESIAFPSSLKFIGENAFWACESLTTLNFPEGLEIIDDFAFECCENLKSVKLPSSLERIGYCSFFACEKLKDVEIPDGVIKIEDSAFYGCKSLEKITIPSSAIILGDSLFSNCNNPDVKFENKQSLDRNPTIMDGVSFKSIHIDGDKVTFTSREKNIDYDDNEIE